MNISRIAGLTLGTALTATALAPLTAAPFMANGAIKAACRRATLRRCIGAVDMAMMRRCRCSGRYWRPLLWRCGGLAAGIIGPTIL